MRSRLAVWRGRGSARRLLVFVNSFGVRVRRLHVLQMRLLARLDGMFRAGRDLFAAVFLFLLDFFVVGKVAWIGYGACGVEEMQGLSEPVPSLCGAYQCGATAAMPELVWEGCHAARLGRRCAAAACFRGFAVKIPVPHMEDDREAAHLFGMALMRAK